ncbi:MAG: DUF3990 domain-containing protein [Alloprevotella sp.]|nr:DUF3990 domain-containing protein [Alloprevotella sp.]
MSEKFFLAAFIRNASNNRGRYNPYVVASSVIFYLAESIEFTCDETLWNIKRFESYDKEWLDFVAGCREGMDTGNYDMIIGGIANDRVIITLDRYFTGEISQEEALGLLRFEKPNIQYCIRTDKMLQKCLTFIGSEQL